MSIEDASALGVLEELRDDCEAVRSEMALVKCGASEIVMAEPGEPLSATGRFLAEIAAAFEKREAGEYLSMRERLIVESLEASRRSRAN